MTRVLPIAIGGPRAQMDAIIAKGHHVGPNLSQWVCAMVDMTLANPARCREIAAQMRAAPRTRSKRGDAQSRKTTSINMPGSLRAHLEEVARTFDVSVTGFVYKVACLCAPIDKQGAPKRAATTPEFELIQIVALYTKVLATRDLATMQAEAGRLRPKVEAAIHAARFTHVRFGDISERNMLFTTACDLAEVSGWLGVNRMSLWRMCVARADARAT